MRGLGRVAAACLVLTLFGARAASAAVAPKAPAAGGLTATPAVQGATPAAAAPAATVKESPPAPPATKPAGTPTSPSGGAPAEAPAASAAVVAAPATAALEDDTSWGVLARGGYFGLPDAIANRLFTTHPKLDGWTAGGELRYHGEGGGRGIASLGLAVDYAKVEGDGIWQVDETDAPTAQGGDISMIAATLTGYWSLFPSWYVHPYFGIGIGAGYFKGSLRNEDELTEVSLVLPVVHIPVGLASEFGKRVQLSVEARFLDGIAVGGAFQIRF